MATKQQVINLREHDKNLGTRRIAEILNCETTFVAAVLKEIGVKARSKPKYKRKPRSQYRPSPNNFMSEVMYEEIFRQIALGNGTRPIARDLEISKTTVSRYRKIYRAALEAATQKIRLTTKH